MKSAKQRHVVQYQNTDTLASIKESTQNASELSEKHKLQWRTFREQRDSGVNGFILAREDGKDEERKDIQ